jgi:hypothetical protein
MKAKRPHASASDSLIRLKAANDRLASSVATEPRCKSKPPASAWSKATEILLNAELERRYTRKAGT